MKVEIKNRHRTIFRNVRKVEQDGSCLLIHFQGDKEVKHVKNYRSFTIKEENSNE